MIKLHLRIASFYSFLWPGMNHESVFTAKLWMRAVSSPDHFSDHSDIRKLVRRNSAFKRKKNTSEPSTFEKHFSNESLNSNIVKSYQSIYHTRPTSMTFPDTYCVRYNLVEFFFWNFQTPKFWFCMLFMSFPSSDWPKFPEICTFLFLSYACPAFQKYALKSM